MFVCMCVCERENVYLRAYLSIYVYACTNIFCAAVCCSVLQCVALVWSINEPVVCVCVCCRENVAALLAMERRYPSLLRDGREA